MIRWGMNASSDVLRKSARCGRCGFKGAVLQSPSWMGSGLGFQTFSGALQSVESLERIKANKKPPPASTGAP